MGLFGRILDDGLTGQQHSRHHDIDRSANADDIQAHSVAPETVLIGGQGNILLGLLHLCAQGTEALQVLIDGTGSKVTATGQRDLCLTEAAESRAHQVIAGTKLADKLRIGTLIDNICAI